MADKRRGWMTSAVIISVILITVILFQFFFMFLFSHIHLKSMVVHTKIAAMNGAINAIGNTIGRLFGQIIKIYMQLPFFNILAMAVTLLTITILYSQETPLIRHIRQNFLAYENLQQTSMQNILTHIDPKFGGKQEDFEMKAIWITLPAVLSFIALPNPIYPGILGILYSMFWFLLAVGIGIVFAYISWKLVWHWTFNLLYAYSPKDIVYIPNKKKAQRYIIIFIILLVLSLLSVGIFIICIVYNINIFILCLPLVLVYAAHGFFALSSANSKWAGKQEWAREYNKRNEGNEADNIPIDNL